LRLKKKIYLNLSSIPNFTKDAKNKKVNFLKNNNFFKIIEFAKKKNFYGLEFPFFRFFNNTEDAYKLKEFLKKKKLNYILDCEKKLSIKELKKIIIINNILNNNFIRLKCSNILSCERSRYKKNWKFKIKSIIKLINKIVPFLKKNNIKLALENHQDLDSNDLIQIIKKTESQFVGVNFDIGNAFATCEFPFEFLKKIEKYLLNIHLKDYLIIKTRNGFALQRCPVLSGDAEIKKIMNYLKKKNIKVPLSLEIGSPSSRNIKVRNKSYFKHFLTDTIKKRKLSKFFLKIAINNSINIKKIKKIISLNEIKMVEESIKNLNLVCI
jgi:sugar phosphate isomerase/epimerase